MKKKWTMALCFAALLGSPVSAQTTTTTQTTVESEKNSWNNVCEQTIEIIKNYLKDNSSANDSDISKISLKTNLKTEYGLDSLDIVDLVMKFEKDFDIRIDDEAFSSYDLYQVEGLVHAIYFEEPHQKARACFDNNCWKQQDNCGKFVASAEKKSGFSVVITEIGPAKLSVVKAVKETCGISLKEAKDLVDATPSTLKEGLNETEAKKIKDEIEAKGATVELQYNR